MAHVHTPGLEPWQEPVLGGYADPAVLSLSGVEQIRSWTRGLVPVPPLSRLTGLRYESFGEGRVSFAMPASPWLLAPQGAVSIGVLSVLADAGLGCAIQTTLPAARPYTTAELSLTALRPVYATGGLLRATGTVVHPGRRLALSEVAIRDEAGRLVAHGTSRCMVLPAIDGLPPAELLEPIPLPDDSDDPWRRPPMGQVLPQEVWDRLSGLEILQLTAEDKLPRCPLSYLTGLRLTEAEHGSAAFVLPASAWLTSPSSFVAGGFIAILADAALQSAIQTTAPVGCAVASVDLKVNYLRPVYPDGTELVARGSVVHGGRSLVVANAVGGQYPWQAGCPGHGVRPAPARPAGLAGGRGGPGLVRAASAAGWTMWRCAPSK
ncbi:MAG: hypothetical protein NVSMB32_05980 [Actinomycetota bacterium]